MKNIDQLMAMKGRVALITGGGGHLGSAMAEALAEAGASIIVLDINEKNGAKTAKGLREAFKVKAENWTVDLGEEKAIKTLPGRIKKEFGRLDCLINSAALVGTSHLDGWAVAFEKQSVETFRKALEINMTSVFALAQNCAPLLKASKNGSIVNIGSIYGMVGPDMSLYEGTSLGNPAAYAASKGGLLQLTRWLAAALAPDIRSNMISIGGVFRNHQEPFLGRYKAKTPLKRMASEEDIKGAALYLASDLSRYVTGHNLVVDGGWTAW